MDLVPKTWDPMAEAFDSGKQYTAGPGADLQSSIGLERGTKIFIKSLPEGITVQGIKYLCSHYGKPLSVHFNEKNRSALVEFKTTNEGYLAIKDLNNTPPYFLKVTYARSESQNNDLKVSTENDWSFNSFYKIPIQNMNKYVKNVSPYFNIKSEFDNPTLVMRQKSLDIVTRKQCISMGRGYFYKRDADIFKCENRVFCKKTGDWMENYQDMTKCSVCGSITYRRYLDEVENVCSSKCEIRASQHPKRYGCVLYGTVIDSFFPGSTGTIEILGDVTDIHVPCIVIPDAEIHNYRWISALSQEPLEAISAEKGEIVIVCDSSNQYHRGFVTDVDNNSYTVALIDNKGIMTVDKVYSLSCELKDIPKFAGTLTFLEEPFSDVKSVRFCAKEEKYFGSWLCDVIKQDTDGVLGEVTLEPWSPRELKYVPLDPKCDVIMSMYKDMRNVFVRRTDEPWGENFLRLCNDIAAYSLEAKPCVNPPKIGEICSARFDNDGCFYRAIVRSVDSQISELKTKSVTVTFLDFGNDQDIKPEDIRYLPDTVRQISIFAVPVKIKGVTDSSTPETVDYYNKLVAYEAELKLTYEGEYQGEVILTESNGNNVNRVVTNLMTPVWKRDPSILKRSGKHHFLDSVGEFLFKPGETSDVFLLNFDADEFKTSGSFWATPYKNDCLCHLNGELKRLITEYCDNFVNFPYRPRVEELCLVQYKGDWYRAVCLNDTNEACDVFLIDFGISTPVEPMNIRKILKEFLEMPALALECAIAGCEISNEDIQPQIIEYMESMNKNCIKNVKITGKVDDVYQLCIPSLQSLQSDVS